MTELEFKFYTELRFSSPIKDHVFAVRCLPMQDEVQQLSSFGISLAPQAEYELQHDGFGGWVVCGSCREEHRHFVYASHGLVRIDSSNRAPLPLQSVNPAFRHASALTQGSTALESLWRSLPLKGKSLSEQADILCRAAHDALIYTQGVTSNATTASQALVLGQGVCQDYTHLLLFLARRTGFAARYCMGLIPGEGATHAWAELALPDGWLGLDPTHGTFCSESHVRFAAGRDAADCPAEQGVFCGMAQQSMWVSMHLARRA